MPTSITTTMPATPPVPPTGPVAASPDTIMELIRSARQGRHHIPASRASWEDRITAIAMVLRDVPMDEVLDLFAITPEEFQSWRSSVQQRRSPTAIEFHVNMWASMGWQHDPEASKIANRIVCADVLAQIGTVWPQSIDNVNDCVGALTIISNLVMFPAQRATYFEEDGGNGIQRATPAATKRLRSAMANFERSRLKLGSMCNPQCR